MNQRIRFLSWFARTDLFEKSARGTSLVVVATLGLLTAAATISLALPEVAERVRLQRLKNNPLSLALWVGDRPLGRKFDRAAIEGLRSAISARLERPSDLVDCCGFYELEKEFGWVLRSGELGTIDLRGRTLAPGDPMFVGADRLLQHGRAFRSADEGGAIISPRLLQALGYPPDSRPETLQVRARFSGAVIDVPIVGITRDALPLGHCFVITQTEEERLATTDPDEPAEFIVTGPIGNDWPKDPHDFSPEQRKVLGRIEGFAETRDNRAVWKLKAPKSRGRGLWKETLIALHRRLVDDDQLVPAPDFIRVIAPSANVARRTDRLGYDRVGIYVADLPALPTAADAVIDAGLLVNESVIGQLREISDAARTAKLVLWGLLSLFGLTVAVNLLALFGLRARQKAPEIGLLRAMGIGDGLLRGICGVEAVFIWSLGSALGLALAAIVSFFAARSLDPGEVGLLLGGMWPVAVASFLAAELALCAIGTLWATRPFRRQSPIISMGASG